MGAVVAEGEAVTGAGDEVEFGEADGLIVTAVDGSGEAIEVGESGADLGGADAAVAEQISLDRGEGVEGGVFG